MNSIPLKNLLLILALTFSTLTGLLLQAQHQLVLVSGTDTLLSKPVNGASEARKLSGKWLESCFAEGKLGSSIDSLVSKGNHHTAYVYQSAVYRWSELVIEDSLGIWAAGLQPVQRKNRELLDSTGVFRIREGILRKLEENGYPFASCSFRDLKWKGDSLYARLHIEKGPQIRFDSLVLKTDARVNPLFLRKYLEISKGDVYNERTVERISTRINEIPYLKSSRPAEVLFAENKASVYLYLEEQKASFANGVIGLQPDAVSGEITITGQIELKLQNGLRRGELIHLNWRKLQAQTQDIYLALQYPYLFGTPLGGEGMLKIYRRDTTFSTVNGRAGLSYMLRGGNAVRVYAEQVRHTRLSGLNAFPGVVGNVSVQSYGAGIEYRRLDYRFNPRSGYAIVLNGKVGNKTIRDSVDTETGAIVPRKSVQYQADVDLQYFIPVRSRFTVMLRATGGLIENELILENEMFRIGGLNSLRGFDEESILASSMGIATIELRYILGRNSRYFLFYDQAVYERIGAESTQEDTPSGFGTGISFETKAGIFSLSYALGREFNNPVLLRGAKVHFGFTSLF